MSRDTKALILDAALSMFNEQGYGKVTVAALAAEVGIAVGNLTYHFSNKRVLLEALEEDMLAKQGDRLAMHPTQGGDVIAEFAAYLVEIVREMRDYRFIYRDQADYGEHSAGLKARLPEIFRATLGQVAAYFMEMHNAGILQVNPKRIPDLAHNVTVVTRYHMEFLRDCGVPQAAGSGAVVGSLLQQLTAYEDQMDAAAAKRLTALIRKELKAETIAA